MPTSNQLVQNLNNGLIANTLVKPNRMELVYRLTQFNVFNLITERIGGNMQADGQYGAIETPLMGLSQVVNTIGTSTQINSTTVQIFWTDPTYNLFRVTDNVVANVSQNIRGLVIAAAAGTITIQSPDGVSPLAVAAWPAGAYVTEQWNSHPYQSFGMESQYEMPIYSVNYTEKTRDTLVLQRDDFSLTWTKPNKAGKQYWAYAQDPLLLERYSRKLEWRSIFGTRFLNNGNGTSGNMGLFESIRDPDRGGVNYPFSTLWTLDDFTDFMLQVGKQYNSPKIELLALCGRSFLQVLQGYLAPYIQYAGNRNTFGGMNVQGLDIDMYAIAGVKIGFIVLPALGDETMNPTPTTIANLPGTLSDNFCFIIDTGMYDSVGNGQKLPAMKRIYTGKREMLYKVSPGVIEGDMAESGEFADNESPIAVNDQDALTLQIYSKSGVDIIAQRMGAFYPTN